MKQQLLEAQVKELESKTNKLEHRVNVLEATLSMLYSDVWMDDNYKAKIAIILAGGDKAASVEKEVLNR